MSVFQAPSGDSILRVLLQGTEQIVLIKSAMTNWVDSLTCDVVLNSGDQLNFYTLEPVFSYAISGAELTLAP